MSNYINVYQYMKVDWDSFAESFSELSSEKQFKFLSDLIEYSYGSLSEKQMEKLIKKLKQIQDEIRE